MLAIQLWTHSAPSRQSYHVLPSSLTSSVCYKFFPWDLRHDFLPCWLSPCLWPKSLFRAHFFISTRAITFPLTHLHTGIWHIITQQGPLTYTGDYEAFCEKLPQGLLLLNQRALRWNTYPYYQCNKGPAKNLKSPFLAKGRRNFVWEEIFHENPYADEQAQGTPIREECLQQGDHDTFLSSEWVKDNLFPGNDHEDLSYLHTRCLICYRVAPSTDWLCYW